jgi:hypothetical protein
MIDKMRDALMGSAEAHGVTVKKLLPRGKDGIVAMLTDGRILKITTSKIEAAIAITCATGTFRHPSVPHFHSAHAIDGTCWAIIRDDVSDATPAHPMNRARALYNIAWSDGDDKLAENILNDARPHGPWLDQLHQGLRALKNSLGIRITDLSADNVGICKTGRIGVRDLGRGAADPERIERIIALIPDIGEVNSKNATGTKAAPRNDAKSLNSWKNSQEAR